MTRVGYVQKKTKNIILKARSVIMVILGGYINMAITLTSLLSHLKSGLLQDDALKALW